MKKIFTLLFASTLLFACSNDSEVSETNEVAVDQSVFDNSNLGVYKGVFTTLDGQNRATVLIELDGKSDPTVNFGFPDGTKAALTSNQKALKGQEINSMSFSGEDFEFDFSVEEDGTNPIITNMIFKGQKGDVLILKETSKAPVSPKTGTYSCLACNDHPELGQPGAIQTFNTILQNTADGTSDITLQATLNSRIYGGQLTQSGCVAGRGGLTKCNLNGTLQAGSGPVAVTGTHLFDNAPSPSLPDGDCSDLSGNFVYSTRIWGEITMSFKTDAPGNCF